MKEKIFKVLALSVFASVCFGIISNVSWNFNETSADETPVDDSYQTLGVELMNNMSSVGTTFDYSTEKLSVDDNGCFLFNEKNENVEVVYPIVDMTTAHAIEIVQRSTDTITAGTYSRDSGYKLLCYAHGVFQLYKQGTELVPQFWEYGIQSGMTIWFKTVNASNGSVHIVVDYALPGFCERKTIFDVYDTESPITGSNYCSYGIFNTNGSGGLAVNPSSLTATEAKTVSIYDVSSPNPLNSCYYEESGKSIILNPNQEAADSGISFPIEQKGSFSYSIEAEPLAGGVYDYSMLAFSIGATKTVGSFPYPTQEGNDSWSSAGYIFYWRANGWGSESIFLSRGSSSPDAFGTQICNKYITMPAYTFNLARTITVSLTELPNDFVKLTFYIDGTLCLRYIDRPSDDATYLPIHMPKSSIDTVGGATTYCNAFVRTTSKSRMGPTASGTTPASQKTVLASHLGQPTINTGDHSYKTGEIDSFSNGYVGYDTSISNTEIVGNLRFNTIGTDFSFLLNYSGTFGSWENKGYKVTTTSAGKVNLYKNDTLLLSNDLNTADIFNSTTATYKFSYTTQLLNTANDVVLIKFSINENEYFHFIDNDTPIVAAGCFAVHSTNYKGSLLQEGNTLPVVLSDCIDNKGIKNKNITLSVENPSSYTSTTYEIDTASSTSTGSIANNILVCSTTGIIVVYAKCDGEYSRPLSITISDPEVTLSGIPSTKIVAGSAPFTVSASLTGGISVKTKSFSIVGNSNIATINSSTGLVTPLSTGRVRIAATLTDNNDNEYNSKTTEGFIDIIPEISLSTAKIGKGISTVLNATFNCDLNGESVDYSLVSGSEFASFDTTTHTLTGVKKGLAQIKVSVASGKTYSTEKTFDINVIEAELITPVAPIIVGGETLNFGAKLSDDSAYTTAKYYSENLTGQGSIDSTTGAFTATAAGTVKVWTVVDNIISEKTVVSISPKITIKNASALALGGTRQLQYEINSELPQEQITVTYSLLDGAAVVDLDSDTGLVHAKAIGSFTVQVSIVGESFSALSQPITIAVENPSVVVKTTPRDLTIGESQTLDVEFGKGEVPISTQEIKVLEGGDLVTTNGLTISAIKTGTVKFKVNVNGVDGIEYTIHISKLEGTLNITDMLVFDTQTLSVVFNRPDYSPEIVYSIVSGADLASIVNNKIVTSDKTGSITVKASVGREVVAEATINIKTNCVLTGISQDEKINVGESRTLSFKLLNTIEVKDVKYTVVSGKATIVENNETDPSKKTATLTVNGDGEIAVKVTVNGVDSEIVRINAEAQPSSNLGLILGLSIGGGVALAGSAVAVVYFVRKRKIAK